MDKYVKLSSLMEYPIRLNHYDKKHGNENFVLGIENILEYAEYLATSDVAEVKHGRWVMKETMIKSPYAKNAYCSECLEETSFSHNYCPNCGAKMDLEENN